MNLETMKVQIRVDNKQAVKGLDETRKAADRAAGRFNGLREKIRELQSSLNKRTGDQNAKEISKNYKEAQKSLENLLRKQEALKRHNTASTPYKSLASDIAKAEKKLGELQAKARMWGEMGYDQNSDPVRALDEEIMHAEERIQMMYERLDAMAEGPTEKEAREWAEISAQIGMAESEVARYKSLQEGIGRSNPALEWVRRFLSGVKKAGNAVKRFVAVSVTGFKSMVGWISKVGRGFGKVLSKIPLLGNLTKQMKGIKRGFLSGMGLRGMIRMGLYGFLIYKGLSAAKEGFKNLAQYSGQTNKDLSMLVSSLATLKNALATAFAPILTAIAPALNYLIQLLVKAATAVAHFTAAFTGKSTVVVAKQQTLDYASSLNEAADAAGGANDAAKAYQKTLLGFDQMNVLNDPDKGSGGSGGGGGTGGGVGDMFETVEVTNGAKALADKIKEAWAAADFTDLGREAGTAIKNALDSIPWDSIQEKAERVGKSIATFLNGLNDSGVWSSAAATVAEGINTIVDLFAGFIDNFSFKGAGSAFADAVNRFFGTVNWKKIGKTISDGIKGVFDFFAELASKTNWEKIGRDLVSVITSIDWAGLIVKGIQAAGSLAKGVLNMLKGVFSEALKGIADWISSGEAWKDIKAVGGAVLEFAVDVGGAILSTISTVLSGIWSIVQQIAILLGIKKKSVLTGEGHWGLTGSGNHAVWVSGEERHPTGGHGVGETGYLKKIEKNTRNTEKNTKATVVPRTLSVLDAFKGGGGAIFSSLGSTGTQAKLKVTAELTKTEDKVPAAQKIVKNMLANLERKKETFGKTAEGMIAGLAEKKETFGKTVTGMVSEFTSRTIGSKFDATIYGMTSSFNKRAVAKGYDSTIYGMVSSFSKAKDAISNKTLSGFVANVTSIKFASNAVKTLSIAVTGRANGGIYRNGRWLPVTAAAGGGSFSTGQMFIAREAGPELVGRIGRGTSVMNNDQIVASVSAGVYEAVLAAMSGNDQSVNVYLMGDAGKLFKAVQKEAIQYMNSTGLNPFPV